MLTNIENRLEELFEMIEMMPQDKVEAAEKVSKQFASCVQQKQPKTSTLLSKMSPISVSAVMRWQHSCMARKPIIYYKKQNILVTLKE